MANEALRYFTAQINEGKATGRVAFKINKKRLQRFKASDVSEAIDVLVAQGYFVADHMTTTYWHNRDMGSESTYVLRVEWDNETPKNPKTGKPYFTVPDDPWGGEWKAQEFKPIPDSEFRGDV